MADNSTRRRVKLYMLNDNRVWDDQGTGHVSSAYVEKFKGMSLLVRSETDGKVLGYPTTKTEMGSNAVVGSLNPKYFNSHKQVYNIDSYI